MKRFLICICACWVIVSAAAQTSSLAIAKDKTISLIFPFPITHVDRGTKDVLVQQVKEADNILLVKAAIQNFPETNMLVVTQDGSVYAFRLNYENNPSDWVWHIPVQKDATISTYATAILDDRPTMRGIHDSKWDVLADVTGIYIKEKVIYYQIHLVNNSPINYDIDLLRFYIRDKKKGKRTAVQERELTPITTCGNMIQVKGNSSNTIVVALDKFTIPDAKYLAIQIMEKNGGRHLLMKVKNNKLVKAIPLPDLK